MHPMNIIACAFSVLLLSLCCITVSIHDSESSNQLVNEYNEKQDFDAAIQELEKKLYTAKRRQSSDENAFSNAETLKRKKRKSEQCKCTLESIRTFLEISNNTGTEYVHNSSIADWNYMTNLTNANSEALLKASIALSNWSLENLKCAKAFGSNCSEELGLDEKMSRMLKTAAISASSSNSTVRKLLNEVTNDATAIYGRARVTLNGKALPEGESGPTEVFAKSRNCSELTLVWTKWRDESGKKIRPYFTKMVELLNIGARENNFTDSGSFEWLTDFEVTNFNELVIDLYSKLSPFYKELHAYVRFKLKSIYPGCIDTKGPIPAQLLGNIWAQQWANIFDLVKPYPNAVSSDVTGELNRQGWTVDKMFKAAEEFFVSIGLFKMTEKFWQLSMFEKPEGRSVDCHGSAHDLHEWNDFRIKMCTIVNQEDFKTIHHEMGHIIYFMSYQHQPLGFRGGANSAFHEAIGDTIALSATTDDHLRKLNLLKKSANNSTEADINSLMLKALEKIAFLPYGLLVDTWRWRVFNGTITKDHYNEEWWKLRLDLQGLKPPVKRTEEDFDPGGKYHVTMNVPYIRYFVSFIIQFQFYEAMCNASGHTGPLHKCDFYQSKEAGALLKSVLSLGSSKPWEDAMRVMTKQPKILLDSILRYFAPLQTWMQNYRREKNYPIGW